MKELKKQKIIVTELRETALYLTKITEIIIDMRHSNFNKIADILMIDWRRAAKEMAHKYY